jgi:hypothetical protein
LRRKFGLGDSIGTVRGESGIFIGRAAVSRAGGAGDLAALKTKIAQHGVAEREAWHSAEKRQERFLRG